MAEQLPKMTVVLMAKLPQAGRVKTRLQSAFSPEQAASIHKAMLTCVLERLSEAFSRQQCELILALDVEGEDQIETEWKARMNRPVSPSWRCVSQGGGDLGERLAFVAERVSRVPNGENSGNGIAFFGVDSPDLPLDELAMLPKAIATGTSEQAGVVAVGPVSDGGYWTLAARPWNVELVADIDWGTSKVYDQTVHAIHRVEMNQVELQAWYDVDYPDDLAALRKRIEGSDEPALQNLARQLKHICEDVVDD